MSDLHSIAYGGCNSSLNLCFNSHNPDMSHFMENNSSTPPFLSPQDSDPTTGYLQDALFEFSSKRRRLLFFSDDQETESTDPIERCLKYWNKDQNSPENFGYLSYTNDFEGKEGNGSIRQELSEDWGMLKETRRVEEEIKEALCPVHPISHYETGKKKKKVIKRVVYPFALVKPGAIEGDMTLNDINERISMPPTRPVKHPVGDFACRPLVSPDGPGLSGKQVVALTKIQTQGSGTITIIRTKG